MNYSLLNHPPIWLCTLSLNIGGFLLLLTANTTAIADIKAVRLLLSTLGGVIVPAATLTVTGKAELEEKKALMSAEATLDVHDRLLQAHVAQFDPQELLSPTPNLQLPQGNDEASGMATTIINTLAAAKKPILLSHIDNKVGCSAIKISFSPVEINHGLEALKQTELIHAACRLPQEQTPAVYMDRGQLIVELPRRDREFMGFELTPSRNEGPPKMLIGYDAMTRQPIEHILTPKGSSPSLLFCGTSGSGKSVWANAAILSLIYRYSPEQVKFAIIDCKGGNYSWMEGSPWLWGPICEDHNTGKRFLDQAIAEGEHRQKVLFKDAGCRDIEGYNKKVSPDKRLPVIVFYVDEIAEWMGGLSGDPKAACKPQEVQASLARIAQALRSAGVVLVVGTQKPVVKDNEAKVPVVGTLLKGNLPFRLCLKVLNSTESVVGLGASYNPDAAQLLGKGDFLWLTPDGKLTRGQSAFVTDDDNTELERLHAIAADFHGVKVNIPSAVEVGEKYLEELERSFNLPTVVPATEEPVKDYWRLIKALKLHPERLSKTKIISLVWGCSPGGTNFDRSNPRSPLSQYERLLEEHREGFVTELLNIGAPLEDISWAAYDDKGQLEAIQEIAESQYLWPYYQVSPEYPENYPSRYGDQWTATSKEVRKANCVLCGERSAQAHHAYYRSWWGKIADNEQFAVGVALFPLCNHHHKPDDYLNRTDCAHHPSNWKQRDIWNSVNTLEFYLKLLGV